MYNTVYLEIEGQKSIVIELQNICKTRCAVTTSLANALSADCTSKPRNLHS